MKANKKAQKDGIQIPEILFDHRSGSIVKRNGEEVFLEYRLKDFFKILLDNKNYVVTREELMNFVWKEVIVNEESVTKAASDLRKFFRINDIHDFKLITIQKIGYKLEIIDPDLISKARSSLFIRFLKITGYIVLGLLIYIIVIRAINY